MPKSVNYVAQELSRNAMKIKKVVVIMDLNNGTVISDDNELTVDEAMALTAAFRNWLRQSNAKHQVDKKLGKVAKKEKYVM